MATKKGEQSGHIALPPAVNRELDKLAIDMQVYVEREGRPLRRGPMLGYVARWFRTLSFEDQVKIVLVGREIEQREVINPEAPELTLAREGDVVPLRKAVVEPGHLDGKDGPTVSPKARRPRAGK